MSMDMQESACREVAGCGCKLTVSFVFVHSFLWVSLARSLAGGVDQPYERLF